MTEIFELIGKVALEGVDKTKKELDDLGGNAEKTSSRFSNFLGGVGKIAVGMGKAVATGIGVASGAIGVLTKHSLDAYGEYEQLVGGVETLFGTGGKSLEEYAKSVGKSVEEAKVEFSNLEQAQKTALENADNAWKNQGISANNYMQTITSFSASLIQSLEGDTVKAVDVADLAITDMSDNANKMGTDMELIQNAYQGFAKQNFDMLDNLKLGYGGTKAEMERLLADAEKIKAKNGEMADYSIDSFADMIEAIHVVQEEMGITGTTALEAKETIEGSANAMKAAWENLMVGFADDSQDLDVLMNNLVESISTYAQNIVPRVKQIFSTIPTALSTLMPTIISLISDLLPSLIESAAMLVSGLIAELPSLISSIASAVLQSLPLLLDGIMQMMDTLKTTILSSMENFDISIIFTKIAEILSSIGSAIQENLPTITSKALDLINGFVENIALNLPILINAGMELLKSIVQGLMDALPTLIEKVPTIVSNIANIINDNLPVILKKGFDIVVEIGKGLIQAIPTLIANIPQIIKAIFDVWNAVNWLNLGKKLITGIWDGIKNLKSTLINGVKEILNNLKTSIDNIFTNISKSASNIWNAVKNNIVNIMNSLKTSLTNVVNAIKSGIVTVWEGIKAGTNVIFSKIKDIASTIWNGIKLSIKGIVDGIKASIESVWNSIKTITTNVWNSIKTAISTPMENAKNLVKSIIDTIKGFFNFKISWPKIPLPHFSISPRGWSVGDLLKGSIPKLGISWYAKGGILEKPTIFGINPNSGNLMAGGEAGKEAVAPISELMDYVRLAVSESNDSLAELLQNLIILLSEYLPKLSNMKMVTDTGVLVGELAPLMDEELGNIQRRKGRK